MGLLLRYWFDIATLVLTYIMLGWGLNIVTGMAGLLDLGYVAFYAVGAYSYALLAHHFGLSFWLCLPLAGFLAAGWGIALGFPVLRLRGEIVTLIGANGAGKSTLIMTLYGLPQCCDGKIIFDEHDISSLPTHEIRRLGIAQSPEGQRIFSRMSVLVNLQLEALLADPQYLDEDLQRVMELFPILRERSSQRGATLSGGEQQMLAIGRALMGRPKLLLLDEPSLGLAPLIVKQIFSILKNLNKQSGLTIFLVEQNAHHALNLADRAYVMVNGRITMSGSGEELLQKDEVRAAYILRVDIDEFRTL